MDLYFCTLFKMLMKIQSIYNFSRLTFLVFLPLQQEALACPVLNKTGVYNAPELL